MITKLEIKGYRAFEEFEMDHLRKINLIVGMNNRGKTSVLEALELVSSRSKTVILNSLQRRGEMVKEEGESGVRYFADISKLFHGFNASLGSRIQIIETSRDQIHSLQPLSKAETKSTNFISEILELNTDPASQYRQKPIEDDFEYVINQLQLAVSWEMKSDEIQKTAIGYRYELSPEGGLIPQRVVKPSNEVRNALFVSTEGFPAERLVSFLERIALTDDEKFIIQSLQIIEPKIDRYATETTPQQTKGFLFNQERIPQKRGVKLKLTGSDEPVPIGTLGDGVWRLLGLIAGLLNTKNGVFLIDEIDTGLHYTVMKKMWEIVSTIAQKFDIQVFATTHSQDCIDSLASVIESGKFPKESFSIQRINQTSTRTVSYSEEEIVSASDHGIEMR